jgi:hypothetical protein
MEVAFSAGSEYDLREFGLENRYGSLAHREFKSLHSR